MADEKTSGGLLAIIGGPKDEGSGSKEKESTPNGRAMKAMWDAMQKGDFEEAGEHYKTAYDLCAESHDEEGDEAYSDDAEG